MHEQQPNYAESAEQHNPLFVNHCVYSKEVYIALQKVTRPLWFRVLLTLVNLLFALVILIALSGRIYDLALQMSLYLLIVLFVQLILPHVRARQQMQHNRALYDAPPEAVTYFFDDHLFSHNTMSDAKASVPYNKISRIFCTKTQYILKLDAQLYILLDRNGFTAGSPEVFENFIRTRIRNTKI